MSDRYDISMAVPGLPFDWQTTSQKALGGAETAGYYMAHALRALGHHVTVFSNIPEGTQSPDGVLYRPINDWTMWARTTPHDVAIMQRVAELANFPINARLSVYWMHDLALGRNRDKINGTIWNTDKAFVLSKFMLENYQRTYGWPASFMHQTRNGIDLSLFQGLDGVERSRKRMVYAARPERGLDVLLETLLPKILEQEPSATLAIAGYDNAVDQMREFYQHIANLIQRFGERIEWKGFLPKRELYELYASSRVYVYPTPGRIMPGFAEISCITAMECQAAGLPIVTTTAGALPETIHPDAGLLIPGNVGDNPAVQTAFLEGVLHLLRDDEAWARASSAGRTHAQGLGWDVVAEDWSTRFEEWIAERNDDSARLVRHFWRRADIVAAKAALQTVPDSNPQKPDLKMLLHPWDFADAKVSTREQYEKIGATHTDVFHSAALEPRFMMLKQWLDGKPEVQRILDFGCAHGSYAVNMANQTGRQFVGVDIDKHSIAWCEKNKATRATTPELLTFRLGDETVDLSDLEPFDLLWMGEVLEHVINPHEVLDALERWVKPGGIVLMTVPFGPWEQMSYDTYPHRAHLWEYDQHDLRDLFSQKVGCVIQIMPFAQSNVSLEPLGWHIVQYVVQPNRPCGPIDMERKLRLQRPRQTLSAVLMAGAGAEETIHWCLRSIRDIADEIVIADTGMNEEVRRIVSQYPVRVISSRSPLEVGFEVPRNDGVAAARMDWVLWIDTDEKLLDTPNLHKFLRDNPFQGYQIRQHHFAVDTSFTPDVPVRVFRRTRPDGQGRRLKFIGYIHEHPEFDVNEGPGLSVVLSDVHIAHVGYLIESGRRQRFMRNLPMLKRDMEAHPDRLLQKHFIMRDNMLQCSYAIQQAGGRITDQVIAWCRETIALYRQYFMGKDPHTSADPLEYYSQALAILGEGFEVAWGMVADKGRADLNGQVKKSRFANREDFETTLLTRARNAVGLVANADY